MGALSRRLLLFGRKWLTATGGERKGGKGGSRQGASDLLTTENHLYLGRGGNENLRANKGDTEGSEQRISSVETASGVAQGSTLRTAAGIG